MSYTTPFKIREMMDAVCLTFTKLEKWNTGFSIKLLFLIEFLGNILQKKAK